MSKKLLFSASLLAALPLPNRRRRLRTKCRLLAARPPDCLAAFDAAVQENRACASSSLVAEPFSLFEPSDHSMPLAALACTSCARRLCSFDGVQKRPVAVFLGACRRMQTSSSAWKVRGEE